MLYYRATPQEFAVERPVILKAKKSMQPPSWESNPGFAKYDAVQLATNSDLQFINADCEGEPN
jgi:hypothetical protein